MPRPDPSSCDADALIDAVIDREGRYVNHPADRGGPTRWGVTEAVARAQGYAGPMRDLPRAEAALARASSLAGSVVWMNPIPENKWPYLNSVQAMLPHCKMVPCSTLNDLARACAKLI